MNLMTMIGCSDYMLRLIFNRMDTGSDHLGVLQFSDQSIAFKAL